ncbi:MAG: transcription termination/antitermination protein NusG [Leptospiraceae bacterium]|nr:transcription termination/antitermination protein NusG [Leptospiraceae bacterium]MDW7975159.1 transcription termination/antitermination protein NusG [Leptospiraceae bacterium]
MKQWYVISTQAGHEKKAKENLERYVENKGIKDKLGQIIVPVVKVPQMRKGKKVIIEKKIMPGYIIAELELDEELKTEIRKVPSIRGFLGGSDPKPLSKDEVRNILNLQLSEKEAETPLPPPVLLNKGEKVKIVDGPYNNFSGIIEDILKDQGKLKIKIEIFGQTTTIEVDYSQVITI